MTQYNSQTSSNHQQSNVYSSFRDSGYHWSSQWTAWIPEKIWNSNKHRDAKISKRRKPISPISISGVLTKEAKDTYEEMAKRHSSLFEELEHG